MNITLLEVSNMFATTAGLNLTAEFCFLDDKKGYRNGHAYQIREVKNVLS